MPKEYPYNQALPAALTAPTAPVFEVRLNQIARIFFQIAGTPFATAAAIKLKATWDGLIAASDATKIVYTPLCSNTKITTSKALASGADTNATFKGLPEYFGEGVAQLSGEFRGKDAASMSSLSDLTQFSLMNTAGKSTLVMYLVNNDGHIFAIQNTTTVQGITAYNFRLGTRGTEGLNSNDVIPFTIDLEPYWDTAIAPFIPEATFDPLAY